MMTLLLLLAIILIYKFLTSWLWWILAIVLLIAIWNFLTSWPILLSALFGALGYAIYLVINQHKRKHKTVHYHYDIKR